MFHIDMSLCVMSRQITNVPFAPLSEPVIFIMLSLALRPQHGYAILKNVAELSEHRVKLSTGTLYGALSRLLDDGLIERAQEENASRGRHKYRLTSAGRRALHSEIARLRALTRVAGLRLKIKEA
ncbi:MAG TPA: PadR family transcriptional regulator [Terriglobales bacterium]|nr:PadR family transcriptional regulator [Terriglobales bacterium]